MKKIIAIVAFSVFASTSAFAGGTVAMDLAAKTGLTVYGAVNGASTVDKLIGKCSTGVGFGGNSAATAYAIVTQHKSGNRAFGGSFDSTAIVYKTTDTVGVGNPVIANPEKSDFTAFNGWTSM